MAKRKRKGNRFRSLVFILAFILAFKAGLIFLTLAADASAAANRSLHDLGSALGDRLGSIVSIGAVFAFALIARQSFSHLREACVRRRAFAILAACAAEKREALATRRAQLVECDAYGVPQMEKWRREVYYFTKSVVAPRLTPRQLAALRRQPEDVFTHLDRVARHANEARPALQAFRVGMSGIEFEDFCAAQLRRHGWNALVTKAGGDQGVDIIAFKRDVKVVVQCKLHAKPVGNKAVQEIFSGKAYESADHGVVVSNNAYTPSARRLAARNRIVLLHFSELPEMERLIHR